MPQTLELIESLAESLVEHRLGNGLRVLLQPDRELPLVAVNLWVGVGSKHERPGRTGLAHLFEHMLFQGSAHIEANEHFRYVQQVGGVANGSTWYDRTNYYETLPSAHLGLGLWLESDRLGFLLPALTSEKLENQRQVVMNERRQRVDNQPYGRAIETLFMRLFPPAHPYHWPVIGWMEDIAAARLDEVAEFFSTHYLPSNAVLTLVGDFDSDFALGEVERYFGELSSRAAPAREHAPRPPLGERVREDLTDRVQLPRLYLGAVTPPFGSDAWLASSLISAALTGGKSSLLYHDLVYRRRLAQDVSSYLFPTQEAGVLLLSCTARPGVSLDEIALVIDEQLLALAASELPAEHFERAVNGSRHAFVAEIEALDERADLLSQYATFFDDPRLLFREPARLAGVTPEALRRAAAALLGPRRWAEVRVTPDGEAK